MSIGTTRSASVQTFRHAGSDIRPALQKLLQNLSRGVSLALDLSQCHPVFVPPVLKRSDDLFALSSDVALYDGAHVVVQDGQQQLGRGLARKAIDSGIDLLFESVAIRAELLLDSRQLFPPGLELSFVDD